MAKLPASVGPRQHHLGYHGAIGRRARWPAATSRAAGGGRPDGPKVMDDLLLTLPQ